MYHLAYTTNFSVQKPNARTFYEKCVAANRDLGKFSTESIRQKMKNFRASYVKANDWRNSTGAGLSEESTETTILGNFEHHFDIERE